MKWLILFVIYMSMLNASCDIKKQYISDCNFSEQSFENYNFSKKTLKNIDFSNANLFGAVFNKSKLTNVNFDSANLFGTFFVEASLKHVTFDKADISSSDFTGVKLSATNFRTAIQKDTIFGKMLIEKDDVIKVKNCKMIVPIKKKTDWYTAMLSLSLDSGNSDEFIIGSLCKWHNDATFKLNNIVNTSKKKRKLTITYNRCKFPVYVSTDSKKTYIEDTYNKVCLKSSPVKSGAGLDYVMVNFESVCGLIGCTDKNLRIFGGPGDFEPNHNGAASGSIYKGYNGKLAGKYNWSAQFDNNFCSGSFYLSGKKRNISLSIHKGCSNFYVSEY